ncbi:DUF459 domain-containing protein [Pseudenhygromyxa sp. WMMC2535]|uniref:SGNH/GDSL hydrolase family protein n=1 Tax=Pseudenhygromyxa sp. WMMC2535 TaxID=2712867 RepID=UPI001555E502|nr:DUF459 domain-containing protein [Pseudenhygromyxa sp. WMMC2535]NVB38349.1 DUF459 domain-containing protein [Pseudenhygromyxa sp. WMMC2535]
MLRRRQWIASLAALSGAALLPRSARAAQTKVLLLGDSMIAGGFGLFLARDLEREHGYLTERRGKSSTGLARPDFYDWIEEGAAARAAFEPDAVVCMFGGNDGQGLYMGRDQWIRYGEAGWDEEYRRRIHFFADAVTAGGEWLFWVGMPPMRLERLHTRVAHMNELYREALAIRPSARFLDIWSVLADDEGNYADHLEYAGKRERVRAGDGIHLNAAGSRLLADAVRPRISQLLGQ